MIPYPMVVVEPAGCSSYPLMGPVVEPVGHSHMVRSNFGLFWRMIGPLVELLEPFVEPVA